MKILPLLLVLLLALKGSAQMQEAEQLADQFWSFVKADSSGIAVQKVMGHAQLDAVDLSLSLQNVSVSFGKLIKIDRKGYMVSNSTGGVMGKGQYVCFNYKNSYNDELLGKNTVFEKLLFYRRSKTEPLKLVLYEWSKRATEISCD